MSMAEVLVYILHIDYLANATFAFSNATHMS